MNGAGFKRIVGEVEEMSTSVYAFFVELVLSDKQYHL